MDLNPDTHVHPETFRKTSWVEITLSAFITPVLGRRYFCNSFNKGGVRGAGVVRTIFKRKYHVFEKLHFSKFDILHPLSLSHGVKISAI